VAAARAGVPERIGTGFRYYSPLFTRRVDERRREGGRHELEYALSFAHRAGAASGPARFPLRRFAEAEQQVAAWLSQKGVGHGFVVVHPGTGGSCPSWPIGHFLRLIERLMRAGVDTVVTVGPDDHEVEARLTRRERAGGKTPLFRQPLERLAALTGRAALVVSNSTAPIHLASAQGTRALAIHAPWPSCGPSRWGPYSERGWALVAVAPGAETWTRRERRRHAAAMMAGLSPERVFESARSMLEGRPPSSDG
jgi:ADP-heptose:LPS heptosyltransferase